MPSPIWEKLEHFDRRWIFLAMAVAIAVPLTIDFRLPFEVGQPVRALYDEIESLPPGTKVLLTIDYDPAAAPEVQPFSYAVLRHLLKRRARVVILTLWDKAPPLVDTLIREVIEKEYNGRRGVFAGREGAPYRWGEDYVYLGFKEGKEVVIAGLGQNLRQMYPSDAKGTPLSRLRIMDGINRLSDFPLIVTSSAGFPGAKEWVQQVVTRYGLRYAAATTAVSVTDVAPYYPRQMFALIGGMRGSAEYESLVGAPGTATRGLNVLTIGHVVVVAAIVLGNVIYFKTRRRGAKAPAKASR